MTRSKVVDSKNPTLKCVHDKQVSNITNNLKADSHWIDTKKANVTRDVWRYKSRCDDQKEDTLIASLSYRHHHQLVKDKKNAVV